MITLYQLVQACADMQVVRLNVSHLLLVAPGDSV